MGLNHFRANHFAARHFQVLRRAVVVVVGGGGWASFDTRHWYRTREEIDRDRAALAITVPDDVIQAAQKAIRKASAREPSQAELDRAEAEFRALLANLRLEWQASYLRALLIEYELARLEQEEAQILLLLFDM